MDLNGLKIRTNSKQSQSNKNVSPYARSKIYQAVQSISLTKLNPIYILSVSNNQNLIYAKGLWLLEYEVS